MTSYLLDTSVLLDFLKGKRHAVEILQNLKGKLTSSVVCLAELYDGIYRSHNKEQQEKLILEFFNNLDTYYNVDEQVAKKFGELRAELKQQGNIIEDIDLFIAATCLVYNLTLITFNKRHFSHIEGLLILK